MDILLDSEENISFHSLLYSTMKDFFNETLKLSNCSDNAAKTLEYYEGQFYLKLDKIQNSSKKRFGTKTRKIFNPCLDYLNLLMFFLAWKKFGSRKARGGRKKQKNLKKNISNFENEE